MVDQMASKVIEIQQFIGGQFVPSKSTRYSNVYNPSTGELIANCPLATKEEVDEAISIAQIAFEKWKNTSLKTRVEIVSNFRRLLTENIDELSDLIGKENGKTIADAKGGILRAIESVDLAINAPHLLKGEYSINVGGEIDTFSMKQPLGVVAAIAPFNFPAMVPIAMTTMAVAVGNCVILKPSEKVPNTALYISKLWKKAGIPDGVWSVVNGDKEAVNAILNNDFIQAITFVGSTRVAEYIYHEGTKRNKRVAAFGGGKNHMVIMPDANIDFAVDSFIGAAYGAASQRCMALSVAMPVGEKTAKIFVENLKKKVEQLKVGEYNQNVDFGPVISQEAKEIILAAIEKSIAEGAKMIVDGRYKYQDKKGFFIGPTLLDYVTPDMEVYKEEVFGPARIVVRVATLDEAIQLINEHKYGNGVTIFTNNGAYARKFKNEVNVGMVGVNVPIPIPVGYYNFGGLKGSKFGESYMFGPDTVHFYTKNKTISERWLEQNEADGQIHMSFPNTK